MGSRRNPTSKAADQVEATVSAAARRLEQRGFTSHDARVLAEHFSDAERRGVMSHGLWRLDWIENLPDLRPSAQPVRTVISDGFERWTSCGALGYLVLAAICDSLCAEPPRGPRLIVCDASPTGVLGAWTRRLASEGLVALLTAISPQRLGHPNGGPPLTGTNPLTIAIPSSDGLPLVVDVSMGKVTHGDVLRGAAKPSDLVPFGGDQAYKAFALAVGLQLFVESLVGQDRGAVMVVAPAQADPVPYFRSLSDGVRLPGDSWRDIHT